MSRAGAAETSPPAETRLLDTVRALSFPRFPGTEGERRAAEIVSARFAAAGLAVAEEPFRASPAAMRRYKTLLHGVGPFLFAAFGATSLVDPLAGALIAVAFLAFIRGASRWNLRVESAFDVEPAIESKNVVARRAASAAATSPVRLVVLAHLDSKSARWSTFTSAMLLLVGVLGVIGLGAWCALAAARVVPRPAVAAVVPLAAVVIVSLASGLFNKAGNESPGAMDNASGLAALVAAAETLPADHALAKIDLTFIATGAEEIGLAGAMRWIQAHERDCPRARTVFVNFDSLGVGKMLLAMNMSGEAPGGRPMIGVVRDAADRAGARLRFAPGVLGAGVDTMPIAARGYPTVTLLGEVLGAASRRFHTRRDTPEHLNEDGLRSAVRVAHEIARSLAI